MNLSIALPKYFYFLLTIFSTCFALAGGNCTPFKVHNLAELPAVPEFRIPQTLPRNWETTLAEKIGLIKTQVEFPEIYKKWLGQHPRALTENQRYLWLACLGYYTSFDTDHDGIPDWSAIIDQQPANILFPADPDQDGDGLLNMRDPQPLQKNAKAEIETTGIPRHLEFDAQKRPEAYLLQQKLYREFGIVAVDHTDEHSASVLRELLFLLRNGYARRFITSLKNVKFVYAFAGHNHGGRIATFHGQAQALSFGGKSVYPNEELSAQARLELLSAFAHEVGHAVLFEKMRARELADVSSHFSGWKKISKAQLKADFFSPVFFEAYPNKPGRNVVSQYALVNRHEWFAEAMAAAVLHRLGSAGGGRRLQPNWNSLLIKPSFDSSLNGQGYWADYTQISDEFLDWFRALMKN